MLNKDINSRFEDWLLSPTETLDFEVKRWLDMSDVESQGLVAKALIALENHGGGFLLFGYQEDDNKKLVPDPNRPSSLEPFLTDAINAIIKRRAEPAFHVEVTLQAHRVTGEEYPLVRVGGGSRVPVRSDSSTPAGSLKQNIYYIRAAGPESRAPLNAAEWDTLLRRVVGNQRDEIIALLRSVLGGTPDFSFTAPPSAQSELNLFVASAKSKWISLNNSSPENHPQKIKLGHYSFAAKLLGVSKNIPAREVIQANATARKYTGWPAFVSLHRDDAKPRVVKGCAEAWTGNLQNSGVGHADFWRIDPKGDFFLLRGYQEDSLDPSRGYGQPGTLFAATLPVWRLGEFLLRVLDLGDVMFEEGFEVLVNCEWHGLVGRHLFALNERRYIPHNEATEDEVRTEGTFPRQIVRDFLPDAVKALTSPMYETFDFFTPPDSFYSEELEEMRRNSM